jgi:hypothetical protein
VAEGAVVVGLTQAVAADWAAAAFRWFAVVAWHRYDVIYRRGGETPAVPSTCRCSAAAGRPASPLSC